MAKQKRCKCGCGMVIIGHPNKKFVNTKHKDRYHNRTNPRGYGLKQFSIEPEDIEDSMHHHDTYSLGQE